MSIILETKNLTKVYNKRAIVKDINMTINSGDIYGFVGENGAGKTTVIRLITNVIIPTSGSFQVFPGEPRKYGDIGAIVENPSISLNLSAYDNIYNQLLLVGRRDFQEIPEILDSVGLGFLINDKKIAKNFSLGMKQRLAIGMAIVGDPKFLVLDEPMNGLDPEGIVEFRNLILKLSISRGIAFLISSHILDELAKVANRFGFISHGKIIEELSSEELSNKCEKRTIIKLNKSDGVKEILEGLKEKNLNFNEDNSTLYIKGDIDLNDILRLLVTANINVLNIEHANETIEDYYMRIIGRKN